MSEIPADLPAEVKGQNMGKQRDSAGVGGAGGAKNACRRVGLYHCGFHDRVPVSAGQHLFSNQRDQPHERDKRIHPPQSLDMGQ